MESGNFAISRLLEVTGADCDDATVRELQSWEELSGSVRDMFSFALSIAHNFRPRLREFHYVRVSCRLSNTKFPQNIRTEVGMKFQMAKVSHSAQHSFALPKDKGNCLQRSANVLPIASSIRLREWSK